MGNRVLLGRRETAVTITFYNGLDDGTLDADVDGAITITAILKTKQLRQINVLENVSPTTRRPANNVPIESDSSLNFNGQLLAGDGSGVANPVATKVQSYDFAKMVWNRGGRVWTYWFAIEEYAEDNQGKGQYTFNLTGKHIDISTGNPVLT